jgi:UTP--glucose-1-phosphate uridylyltransferase
MSAARVNTAVIPVAGLGTRMLPATKAVPKELLPVYDRPIIEHIVNEAISGGISHIIFVTRSGKEAIENHFDANYELEHRLEKKGNSNILGTVKDIIPSSVKVSSVRQNDALGLGHAVLCAKHLLNDEPFAVLLPDMLILDSKTRPINFSFSKLVASWDELGIGQILVESVPEEKVESFGIVDPDLKDPDLFKPTLLRGIVEKPNPENAPSNLAVIGRYILPSKVLDILETIAPGVAGEIQLTDALCKLISLDGLSALKTDAFVADCGNKRGLLQACIAVALRDGKNRDLINKTINLA